MLRNEKAKGVQEMAGVGAREKAKKKISERANGAQSVMRIVKENT